MKMENVYQSQTHDMFVQMFDFSTLDSLNFSELTNTLLNLKMNIILEIGTLSMVK